MAIANPIYLEHPDLPGINGQPAYQLVPDSPGVVEIQQARGWVVKDLPPELDPDAVNTGLGVHTGTPEEEKPAKKATAKKADQSKEGDDK
jgi:hypothetical protein